MWRTLALAFCLLTGCKSLPGPVEQVPVVVEKIVPVPPELTGPCDPVPKQNDSVGEMKRVVNARAESIKECNSRMDKIRALGK